MHQDNTTSSAHPTGQRPPSLAPHTLPLKRIAVRDQGDYNHVYPEDDYMEEMGDHARVWRVYNDEADKLDEDMVTGWKSTLDTLLIFVRILAHCLKYRAERRVARLVYSLPSSPHLSPRPYRVFSLTLRRRQLH